MVFLSTYKQRLNAWISCTDILPFVANFSKRLDFVAKGPQTPKGGLFTLSTQDAFPKLQFTGIFGSKIIFLLGKLTGYYGNISL